MIWGYKYVQRNDIERKKKCVIINLYLYFIYEICWINDVLLGLMYVKGVAQNKCNEASGIMKL